MLCHTISCYIMFLKEFQTKEGQLWKNARMDQHDNTTNCNLAWLLFTTSTTWPTDPSEGYVSSLETIGAHLIFLNISTFLRSASLWLGSAINSSKSIESMDARGRFASVGCVFDSNLSTFAFTDDAQELLEELELDELEELELLLGEGRFPVSCPGVGWAGLAVVQALGELQACHDQGRSCQAYHEQSLPCHWTISCCFSWMDARCSCNCFSNSFIFLHRLLPS